MYLLLNKRVNIKLLHKMFFDTLINKKTIGIFKYIYFLTNQELSFYSILNWYIPWHLKVGYEYLTWPRLGSVGSWKIWQIWGNRVLNVWYFGGCWWSCWSWTVPPRGLLRMIWNWTYHIRRFLSLFRDVNTTSPTFLFPDASLWLDWWRENDRSNGKCHKKFPLFLNTSLMISFFLNNKLGKTQIWCLYA